MESSDGEKETTNLNQKMTDFQGDKVTKYTQLLSNISNCGSKAKRLSILQKIE